jgi:hydroxymethylbilane synthase
VKSQLSDLAVRAAAARTLAKMRAYAKAVVPHAERPALMRVLGTLPPGELAAMNPVAAEHEVEHVVHRLRGGDDVPTTRAICASRASALAMTQTRYVAAQLAKRGIATEILNVSTVGDRTQDRAIERLGSANVFVTELEVALREGRADYAVHSCKDLPSELSADMQLAAISPREDPRDAFCSERFATFQSLPAGAVVGTSSPRRRSQLAAMRPDLCYDDVRGNVDTRLRKLHDGQYDAIVLAMAGLNRLRVAAPHTVPFGVDELVPAVAQGALAVEVRAGDDRIAHELRSAINDARSELCVTCERSALRAMRAGCSAPIGIYAHFVDDGSTMSVRGCHVPADGSVLRRTIERRVETVAEAEALGEELASHLGATA